MSFIVKNYRQKRQTRQMQPIKPVFQAYQVNPEELDLNVLFNKDETATTSPNRITLVGGGTTRIKTVNKPIAARKYETVFAPETEEVRRPTVTSSGAYLEVTGAVAADGIEVEISADLSNTFLVNGTFALVVKSETASVPFTVVFEDGAANTVTYSMTTSADINTWTIQEARLSSETDANNMNWDDIVGVSVLTAGVVDLAQLSVAKSTLALIGKTLTLTIPCISAYELEHALETADVMCNDAAEETTATERTIEMSLTTNQMNLQNDALFKGHVAADTFTTKLTALNNLQPVESGTVTLLSGLIVRSVVIDNAVLQKAPNAAQAAIDETLYFYDQTTGILTVSAVYNGQRPEVSINEAGIYSAYTLKNVETGYVGSMDVVMVTDGVQQQFRFFKVQLVNIEGGEDEAADTITYNFKMMIQNGRYYEKIVTGVSG